MQGFTAQDAIKGTKLSYPATEPNPGFYKQLKAYEVETNGQSKPDPAGPVSGAAQSADHKPAQPQYFNKGAEKVSSLGIIPIAQHSFVKQSEFKGPDVKTQYVADLLNTVIAALNLADKEYEIGFRHREAYVEYVVASEILLHLTSITKDDVGFQQFAKGKFEYTCSRAQFCKGKIQKEQAQAVANQ